MLINNKKYDEIKSNLETELQNNLNSYNTKIDEIYGKLNRSISKINDFNIDKVKEIIGQNNNIIDDNDLLKQYMNNIYALTTNCKNEIINHIDFVNELNNIEVTSKKKVLICGFYGALNLGDELMLETLLDYLEKRVDLSITVMLSNYSEYNIFKYNSNIHYIHYPVNRFSYDIISNNFDTLIIGGGALIDDSDYNVKYDVMSLSTTVIELSRYMISKKKDVYWLGLSSIRKFTNNQYINHLNYIVSNCENIYLRDEISIDSFKENKINVEKVKLLNDLVFANPLVYDCSDVSNNVFGIIMVCDENLVSYETNKMIVQTLIYNLKKIKKDYKIKLIPFYDFYNNDITYLNKLANDINDKNISVEKYAETCKDIINIYKKCNYIISMRYHGSLIAMAQKKKLLTIVLSSHLHYYNKMNYLYDKYAYDKNMIYTDEINEELLISSINKLINKKEPKFDSKVYERSSKELENIINKI